MKVQQLDRKTALLFKTSQQRKAHWLCSVLGSLSDFPVRSALLIYYMSYMTYSYVQVPFVLWRPQPTSTQSSTKSITIRSPLRNDTVSVLKPKPIPHEERRSCEITLGGTQGAKAGPQCVQPLVAPLVAGRSHECRYTEGIHQVGAMGEFELRDICSWEGPCRP